MFRKHIVAAIIIFSGVTVFADDIHLEFLMPSNMFGPGLLFSLDLAVENSGNEFSDAQLFVALTVGTGDYWFYPSWVQYPPDIDWENVYVPGHESDLWVIIPEFYWPYGAGSFDGAMFLAAVLDIDHRISNLAVIHFGWSEDASPTPTPPPAPTGFVYIPPGTYMRGSLDDESCREPSGYDETLQKVTLTRGFYMMTTEVTRQMWADLKAVQPSLPADPSLTTYSPTMDHPVQNNEWYETVLFANLMSQQYGYTQCYYIDAGFRTPVDASNYMFGGFYCNFNANGYRLPTEAEWEYACRGGTTGPFSCSELNYNSDNCTSCIAGTHPTLEQYCVYCANNPEGTEIVGSRHPNPWGLCDMHGNVQEWCWDLYGSYPTGSVTDPTGPSTGFRRVKRGGSWDSGARRCRSAHRSSDPPINRGGNLGFRLLRNAED